MINRDVGRIGLTGFTLGFLFSGVFFVYRFVNYDSTNPDPVLELMFMHPMEAIIVDGLVYGLILAVILMIMFSIYNKIKSNNENSEN